MNILSVKGNWNEITGKLQQKYANLKNDRLLFEKGKKMERLGILQQQLGKAKDEILDMLGNFTLHRYAQISWAQRLRMSLLTTRNRNLPE